jgi:acetaldehyde dehydrogenase/alcohol dehydrogenase
MKRMHIIDSLESLEKAIAIQKSAQKTFREFSQEQVDKIFAAAAGAANDARVTLAEMAVKETGMGVVADKVVKNNFAAETIYDFYKDTKTCGIIERDDAKGEIKIAAPVGLIAAVIPTTNPTSTAIFKCLLAIKTRNAIIISPHPRAKNCTVEAAKIVNEAAKAAGLPDNIIAWVDKANLEMTNTVMHEADIILATGGPGMVRSAYSSGKPAIGVGAGNTPAIIDSTADISNAVASIIESKTFDNGMICASEQSVICLSDIYDNVRKEFEDNGCYILKGDETDKVRKTIIINNSVNSKIVGQTAETIAKLAGVEVAEKTKILIGEVDSVNISEEFAHEKLSPVLALYKAYSFDDALAKAEQLIEDGGLGHTASVHINANEAEKLAAFAERLKACRMLVNMPASQGAIGLVNPALPPSLTLGCGSWGGNSVSENVGVRHLLNIKTLVINKTQGASK